MTKSTIIIGDCRNMVELADNSIQLIVTSPPYFNIKDYEVDNIGSINDYETYLRAMRQVFSECYRVLEEGRYICVNISDIISGEKKLPIPCHFIGILQKAGFQYREDILWKKPSGLGSCKRFGTLVQNPYPMYYFPNNIYEHILVFRKGKFDYKKISKEELVTSKIDLDYAKKRWSTDVWEMTPETSNINHPAMFPEALPTSLIKLYTYKGETVLDPFLGSGTTVKAAIDLHRNAMGYEINKSYLDIIKTKIGYRNNSDFEIIIRGDIGE